MLAHDVDCCGSSSELFLSAHEFEVVNLLQLGEDELSPHVGQFHLQFLNLHVIESDSILDVVQCALGVDPAKKSKAEVNWALSVQD